MMLTRSIAFLSPFVATLCFFFFAFLFSSLLLTDPSASYSRLLRQPHGPFAAHLGIRGFGTFPWTTGQKDVWVLATFKRIWMRGKGSWNLFAGISFWTTDAYQASSSRSQAAGGPLPCRRCLPEFVGLASPHSSLTFFWS